MAMDLMSLVVGIVIGAAFSPFWMKCWNWVVSKVSGKDQA